MPFKNNSGLEFVDISSELKRTYQFANGVAVVIDKPMLLNVSKSGGHRIFDAQEVSHYVPSGWIHLFWNVAEGAPNFVK